MPIIELTHPQTGKKIRVRVDRVPDDMDAFVTEVMSGLEQSPRQTISPTIDAWTQTALRNQQAAPPEPQGAGIGASVGKIFAGTRQRASTGMGDLRRTEALLEGRPKGPLPPSAAAYKMTVAPSGRQALLLEELKGQQARLGKAKRNLEKTPWYDVLGKQKWQSEIERVTQRLAVIQDTLATIPDMRPMTGTVGLSKEQIRGRSKVIQRQGLEPGRETMFGEVADTGPDWRAALVEAMSPFAPRGSGQDVMDVGNEILYGVNDAIRKVPILGPILVGLAEGTAETVRKVGSGDFRAIPEFFDPTQLPADPWAKNFSLEEKITNTAIGMMMFYGSKGGPPGAEIVPGMLYQTPKIGIAELRAGLRRTLADEGLTPKQAGAIANLSLIHI